MVTIPPQPWPTGLADDVEPLVRRVLAPNPSPYTFTGTQSYVVGAASGPDCAVIDPGPDEAAHLDAIIAAIKAQSRDAALDLNGDGEVDILDLVKEVDRIHGK